MEGKVPLIWQTDCEPICFFKVWYVPENDYGFTYNAYGVQRNPHCVAQPRQNVDLFFIQLGDIVWVPVK